ncbi:MAG: aspartyl/asparaginyl beta-hydroxylase domain-containing protein [Deltaproteobacteria bacterium]|nr:aspartyl/asparaginyl beta-hydroxylase domain-containing protein [Deltaproteobacteria bacterium]MBW2726707.1 aspartyl/asparaginyl beta-hydroxylase domain-containing protein [Deltaproteobacteria bacterium]
MRGRVATFIANQSTVGDPAIFESTIFPWAAQLEDETAWKSIQREAAEILSQAERLPAFQEISPDQQRISPDDKWKTFFFHGIGYRCERNLLRCPETARWLETIPGLETAFFSILAPGKRIKRHRGITKGLIRCHLPLIVPGDSASCGMRINKEDVGWEEGKLLIFDDSRKHRVWNDTASHRVVLLFDVRRPMRLPGTLLLKLLLRGLRMTRYVQDARVNEAAWEESFYAHP